MKNTVWTAVMLLLAAASAVAAEQGESVNVKYRLWQPAWDGTVSSDEAGIRGDNLSLGSRLEVEDFLLNEVDFWGMLPGLGNLRATFLWGDMEGVKTLSSNQTFSGTLFAAGTEVETDMEFNSYSLLWNYPLQQQQLGGGSYSFDAQLGYHYYFVRTRLEGGGLTGSDAISAPMIYGGFRVFSQVASWLYLDGQLGMGLLSLESDVDSEVLNWSVEGLINPFGAVFLGIGYRKLELEIEDERSGGRSAHELDAELEGFFASASLSF